MNYPSKEIVFLTQNDKMTLITDDTGRIIIALDDCYLYFNRNEPDDTSIPVSSISLDHLLDDYHGGLKLLTILNLQVELNLISDLDGFKKEVCKKSALLRRVIENHQIVLDKMNERTIILEIETSGPASSFNRLLFLTCAEDGFELASSSDPSLLSTEIIEYYGLEDNEFWDQIQSNGEFFETGIENIKTGEHLFNGVVSILTNEDLWKMQKEEIPWQHILDSLLNDNRTKAIGEELGLYLENLNNFNV